MHGTIQTIGPLARNLGDATLALRVLSKPHFSWSEPDSVDVDDLDIRWAPGEGTMPVDEEIRSAVRTVAISLDASEYDGLALSRANALFGALRSVETHADIHSLAAGSAHAFDADITAMLAAGRDRSSAECGSAVGGSRGVDQRIPRRDGRHTLILPVASVLAPPLGVESFEVDGRKLTWMDALASCRAISVLGLPSVVVPVGLSRNGLPIGVQVVARPFREHVALSVAARITSKAQALV